MKRNIHFAAACSPGAKNRLPIALQSLIGELFPSDPGIVHICSSLQTGRGQDGRMNCFTEAEVSMCQRLLTVCWNRLEKIASLMISLVPSFLEKKGMLFWWCRWINNTRQAVMASCRIEVCCTLAKTALSFANSTPARNFTTSIILWLERHGHLVS